LHRTDSLKYHKKLNGTLELYENDKNRLEDLKSEIEIIAGFLPKQLSKEEVIQMISKIKASLESPNMGSLMKELSPQIKGKFDGKLASQLVKDSLS